MDASCKIQGNIHVFSITNKSMCPDFWVHINFGLFKGVFILFPLAPCKSILNAFVYEI